MIESMSISKMVQTSKMKKALQTTVPTATSTLLYLVIFTCVVIEKAILIHNYPENTQIYLETLLIIVAYQVTAMLYIGLCYKYFVAATICFLLSLWVLPPVPIYCPEIIIFHSAFRLRLSSDILQL